MRGASSHFFRNDPKRHDLDFAGDRIIQFDKTRGAPVALHSQYGGRRKRKKAGQCFLGQHGSGKPQPVRSDSSVQFAIFNGDNSMLASQTEAVDTTMQAEPFGGFAVNKDYTFPINGALVALSGTKYVLVKILDPNGNVLTPDVIQGIDGLCALLAAIMPDSDTEATR